MYVKCVPRIHMCVCVGFNIGTYKKLRILCRLSRSKLVSGNNNFSNSGVSFMKSLGIIAKTNRDKYE